MSFTHEACSTCKLCFICAAYPLIKDNPSLDMAMIGCRYYEQDVEAPAQGPVKTPVPETHSLSIAERLALAEEIKAATAKEEDYPVIHAPEKGLECCACGQDDVQLLECSKCGRLVCGDCATDTLKGESLCPECYESSEEVPSLSL